MRLISGLLGHSSHNSCGSGARRGVAGLFAALLLCFSGPGQTQSSVELLLGATGTDHSSGKLYIVNPMTGTATELYPITDGSAGGGVIDPTVSMHGLAADAGGSLFGIDEQGNAELYSIDLATGVATLIGSTGQNMTDITFIGATLYGIDRNERLYTIDTATGLSTLVPPGNDVNSHKGLAADSSGDLFGSQGDDLYSINPADGVSTYIGDHDSGGTSFGNIRSLAFNAMDSLFGVEINDRNSDPNWLVQIDPGTGFGTPVGAFPQLPNNLYALAFIEAQDTDSDGMPDFYEDFVGLDKNTNDAAGDLDMDGLNNLDEYNLGTNANGSDTDNDGVSDGDEVNVAGTDPNNPDSDQDGVGDGGEIGRGTDPLVADSSGFGIILSGDGADSGQIDAAQDSQGRFHVVWTEEPDSGEEHLFYSLLAADGSTLIARTNITDGFGDDARWPILRLDASGNPVVAFQISDPDVYLLRLDVTVDDLNGDAATDPGFVALAPVQVSGAIDAGAHPDIAVDAAGNVHFVYSSDGDSSSPDIDLLYTKVDSSGGSLVGEQVLPIGVGGRHQNVSIVVDSAGNAHIFSASGDSNPGDLRGELFYTMVDGSDGSVLIAPTLMTVDDGEMAKWPTAHLNSDGTISVVFAQRFPNVQGEIYLTRINPALDDQDGSAANINKIGVVTNVQISPGGDASWHVRSKLNADGTISIADYEDGCNSEEPFSLMRADANGNLLDGPVNFGETSSNMCIGLGALIGDQFFWPEDEDTTPANGGFDRAKTAKIVFDGNVVTPNGAASVSTNSGNLSSVEALALADLPAAAQGSVPAGTDFGDGFFQFVIDGVVPGGTVNVTMDFPTALAASLTYYKWDSNNGWQVFPHAAGANANQIVLTITDGGAGDADGVANGQIVDPGGPSFTAGAGGGGGGGGGGIFNGGGGGGLFNPLVPGLLVLFGLGWRLARRRQLR